MTFEDVVDAARRMGPLASFCTTGTDGTPHVVPLVLVWVGSDLVFGARAESLKVRHLAERPVAAVQYLTPGEEFPDALLLKGHAAVVADDVGRRELWDSGDFPFLPRLYEGPTDPRLCFVRFTPDRASLIREAGLAAPDRWRASHYVPGTE